MKITHEHYYEKHNYKQPSIDWLYLINAAIVWILDLSFVVFVIAGMIINHGGMK